MSEILDAIQKSINEAKERYKMDGYSPEPHPLESHGPDIADLVCEDIQARKEIGIKTYGMPLRANNGRKALRDAYAEILDMAHYVKQEMEEREALADLLEGLAQVHERESAGEFHAGLREGLKTAASIVRGKS